MKQEAGLDTLCRTRGRVAIAALAVALFSAVGPALGAAPQGTVTIPAQGGNNKLLMSPGDVVHVGYDFSYTRGISTSVDGIHAELSVTCKDKSTPLARSVTVHVASRSYDDDLQNSNGWVPSGDQGDVSVYQGHLEMPALCGPAGLMVVGQTMGPFEATFASTNPVKAINVRWHYGDSSDVGHNGSSWSATKSVLPFGGSDQPPKDQIPQ